MNSVRLLNVTNELVTPFKNSQEKEQVMSKKTIINRLILSCTCFGLMAWMMASLVLGQSAGEISKPTDQGAQTLNVGQWWNPNPLPKITFSPVETFSTHTVIPATGTMLIRNRDDVFASMNTTGLTPGTAVTLWWVFFNNPHNCATRPCTPADLANPAVQGSIASAGGKIVGADGTASFGAYRTTNDKTGVFPGMGTGEGLLDALRAEIHLVVRNHGPALINDPVMLNQQLSLFNGGCPPNTCANVQASAHRP